MARRGGRGGGGLRVLGGGLHGGGRAHGHRQLQFVLLLAGPSRRTSKVKTNLTFRSLSVYCVSEQSMTHRSGGLDRRRRWRWRGEW